MKTLAMLALGAVMLVGFVGCDEDTLAKMSDNPAVQNAFGGMYGAGSLNGDHVWQQDRLRDGSGENCVNGGDCDGTGPYGFGNQGTGGQGGVGSGDRLQLRDGSCGG